MDGADLILWRSVGEPCFKTSLNPRLDMLVEGVDGALRIFSLKEARLA